MADVQFEDENYNSYSPQESNESKGLIGLILKTGIAKDENQANIVLIVSFIIFITLAIIIFFFSGSKPSKPSLEMVEQAKQMQINKSNSY